MVKEMRRVKETEIAWKRFCEAVQSPKDLAMLFTIIPPPLHSTTEKVKQRARSAANILRSLPLSALNIPEVLNETRNGPRVSQYSPKVPPRDYARMLRQAYQEIPAPCPEMIVNRVVVRHPATALQKWFQRTHKEFNISSFLLVGGESSQIHYPGPSVPESARLLNQCEFPHLAGGVTIPTRRHSDPSRDEPHRLLRKMKSGLSFFTSQILFEASSMRRLLMDFTRLCQQKKVSPGRIFLSFAPLSREKDLQFMRWLGVEISDDTAGYLLENPSLTEERSVKYAETLFRTILDWVYSASIPVPIGLNVEHVMTYNLDLSVELTRRLARVAQQHPLFSNQP